MSKTLITFQNFKMSQSNKVLLDNVNVSIHQFDRIVLVGQNGCGKSSLLSLLKNKEVCDAGSIWIAPNLKIDYLEQDPPEPSFNNLQRNIGHLIGCFYNIGVGFIRTRGCH